MHFNQYCRVKLNTDKYINKGVGIGSVGYIIEVYVEGSLEYEVEFSNPATGESLAQIVVTEEEIEIAE